MADTTVVWWAAAWAGGSADSTVVLSAGSSVGRMVDRRAAELAAWTVAQKADRSVEL